jgi:hypothetical protein
VRRNASGSAAWQQAYRALRARDYAAAHVALGRHFAERTSPFPFNARDRQTIASAIRTDFPDAPAGAAAGARARGAGRAPDIGAAGGWGGPTPDLLGYAGLSLGTTPDWHTDSVNRRHSPRTFWSTVPYLEPSAGDHKVIWELNRHQHWLTLGRAAALTGNRAYYDEFTAQLASWLAGNPPLIGTNWASMLELAFRSFSWMWALELFAPDANRDDREPWLVDLLLALDRQLTHIEHNLSHYFSPNTHLSGEALALYVAGVSLPELKASRRRIGVGRDVLVQEAGRQVRADGGHAELSTHYHRYSTDFYLLAAAVARRAADPAAPVFEQAARRQARYLRTVADDAGRRPQIGDDDGGQFFPICGRGPADCRDTLAIASLLVEDPALTVDGVPEEAYWMCGLRAREARAAAAPPARWTSAALNASGYFVSRTPRGDHLVFDAGPHGFLNGGHAHADALSLTLSVDGAPLLIDPGTATYTMDRHIRDRFRSTPMHNALTIDGRSQSEPRGPFHWKSMAGAHAPIWRCSIDCDYVEGTHAAYAPIRHTRGILAIHGIGWWIVDHVLGDGTVLAEQFWHFHPAWGCTLGGRHLCRLHAGDRRLALASTASLSVFAPGSDPLAVRSPAYGVIEPAPVARGAVTTALPASIGTFIPAVPELVDQLTIEPARIETVPGSSWHAAAFRVRWNGGAMIVVSAVERTGIANRDNAAPAERWGTAELQTDGRAAVLIDRRATASETVLVNGTFVAAHPSHRLVSLSQPVPLLRLASAGLAPGVHEVGVTAE